MLLRRHATGPRPRREASALRRRHPPILATQPLRLTAAAAAAAGAIDAPASVVATSDVLAAAAAAAAAAPARSELHLSYRAVTTAARTYNPAQQYAPGPPQLRNRDLTLNPLHALTNWASGRLRALDLMAAAVLDRRPALQVAAAVALAALTCLDLHPMALLHRGLPLPLVQWVEDRAAGWAVAAAGAVVAAAGSVVAAWQARTWLAAQLAALRIEETLEAAVAARSAAAAATVAEAAAATAPVAAAAEARGEAAAARALPQGPFARLIPSALRGIVEEDWKPTDRTWLYILLLGRLSALSTAALALLSGANAAAALYTALCFAASLLPLALPHVRQLLSAHSAASRDAVKLAAPLVAADAAFLLALAPAAPLAARAVGAGVLAGAMALAALAAAASPRLAALRAADGDAATFDVTVRLPLSGTPIDSTIGHQPLRGVVGRSAAATAATAAVNAADAAAAAAAARADARADAEAAAAADSRVAGTTAALRDPQARFRPLAALLAARVLRGMYVGESRSVVVAAAPAADVGAADTAGAAAASHDPDAPHASPEVVLVEGGASAGGSGGEPPFANPGLVWWQRLEDMTRKAGRTGDVAPGAVFWYPLGDLVAELGATHLSQEQRAAAEGLPSAMQGVAGVESWGPVRVAAVCGEWVQLDGNVGLAGGEAEVEVRLVALDKAAAA